MRADPPPSWVPDADPVETAAAVATTMRRLVAETSALTNLDQTPQITDELLDVLGEIARVTTQLSLLSFEHPPPAPPAGIRPDGFKVLSAKSRAVNGFNDTSRQIYVVRQALAAANNATTELLDHTEPNSAPSDITTAAVDDSPSYPGHYPDRPHPPHPGHQSEPAHTPLL